jgi:hypothetical protein
MSGPAHERCRNLLFEDTLEAGGPAPGKYCVNRLGAFSVLDCPVFQGLSCCLYDARPEGEAPAVPTPRKIEETKGRLGEDYLRWRYWQRVARLRDPEEP